MREIRTAIKISRSQKWYKDYSVKRPKTELVYFLKVREEFHILIDFNTSLPIPVCIFFIRVSGGDRIGDFHIKSMLLNIEMHNTKYMAFFSML